MNIKDLAKALKQHMRQLKLVPEGFINVLSDERILSSYAICIDCGKRFIEEKDLVKMIAEAEDVDDFCDCVVWQSITTQEHCNKLFVVEVADNRFSNSRVPLFAITKKGHANVPFKNFVARNNRLCSVA